MVQAINIVPGQLTSALASGTAAVQMESSAGLEVVADVAEADIGSIRVGDPVAMTFNAYPNQDIRRHWSPAFPNRPRRPAA